MLGVSVFNLCEIFYIYAIFMLLSCKPWMCKWLDVCRNSAEEAGRRTAWNFTCHRWWDSRARHQCTLWLCFQVHMACMCLCALDIYAFKRKLSFKRFCTELLLKQIQNEIKQKVCPIFYLLAIFIEISKPNNKHNKNYLLTTVFCCVNCKVWLRISVLHWLSVCMELL